MKRATLIAALVATYWIVRVVASPAPAAHELPATIEELQVLEAKHISTEDAGTLLDDHTAPLTDAQ